MTSQSDTRAANDTPNGGICYIFGVLYPLLCHARGSISSFDSTASKCLLLFALLVPLLYVRWRPVSFISLVLIVGWLVAMIQARRRKMFHLPLLGYLAERMA
jgi:uncharacterized membrane protein